MNYFNNVNFNFVKEDLTEGILKKVHEILTHYKICFLKDPLYFNCILSLSTTINFFNEDNIINETVDFKPLAIEDFLYCNLQEIIFNIKICLKQSLYEMKEKNHLHFYKFYIVHTMNANCELKEKLF